MKLRLPGQKCGAMPSGFFSRMSVLWWMRCETILCKKRGGLRKGGKTGHLRSEDDYPNFKGRMMEAPRNIRTVIISVGNMGSVGSGCQPPPVLIHPPSSSMPAQVARIDSPEPPPLRSIPGVAVLSSPPSGQFRPSLHFNSDVGKTPP